MKIACNHAASTTCSAKKQAGKFDAVFLAVGAQVGNHLDIPAMDGGKMIHALTLLEQTEQGRAPRLGRVVGIIGAGNTAVDVARVAKRLGAEEAVLIYRSDRQHMRAHPYEAAEAFAEGVKVRWMSTVKQFGSDEIVVEEMEMAPDGTGTVGTGRFERLQADSLVLAVGEHSDVGFPEGDSPASGSDAGDVVEVDEHMHTGDHGIFAGGDMIGGARTMTAAVGHGKKAARNIDAWLRGEVYESAPKHPIVDFADAQPADVPRCRSPAAGGDSGRRSAGVSTRWSQGLSEPEARYEASRCLSCGNCFECDNCLRVMSRAGDRQARHGPLLSLRLRPVHGLRRVLRAVPVPRHRNAAGARGRRGDRGDDALPARFTVRP